MATTDAERLARLLRALDPGSLWWLAIAIRRGELLRREATRALLLWRSDPSSVLDLTLEEGASHTNAPMRNPRFPDNQRGERDIQR